MKIALKLSQAEAETLTWALARGAEALQDADPELRGSYLSTLNRIQHSLENPGSRGESRRAARTFLVEFLRQQEKALPWADVVAAGRDCGHSEMTLRRARDEAPVVGRRAGRQWLWALQVTPRNPFARFAQGSEASHEPVDEQARVVSLTSFITQR